jgi:hypothetical protein
MNAIIALFCVSLTCSAAELRVSLGMPYQEATNLVCNVGGMDITRNTGWLFGGLKKGATNGAPTFSGPSSTPTHGPQADPGAPKWSFWELSDYEVVVLVLDVEGSGKVTSLSWWARDDFDGWTRQRERQHRVVRLTFNPGNKSLEWEDAPNEESRPNPQGGANGWQPSKSETNQTPAAAAPRRSP